MRTDVFQAVALSCHANAYLALGVHEVWLVDAHERSVEVSREQGRHDAVRNAIIWRVPTLDLEVRVELSEVFAGIE